MLYTILDALTPPPEYYTEACWVGTVVLTLLAILFVISVPRLLYYVLSQTMHTAFWYITRIIQVLCVMLLIAAAGVALNIRAIIRVALLGWYVASGSYRVVTSPIKYMRPVPKEARLDLQFAVLPRVLHSDSSLPIRTRAAILEVWADVLADSLRGWKLPEIQAVLARIESHRATHKEYVQLALISDIYSRVGSCTTFARADWAGLDRVRDSVCPAK